MHLAERLDVPLRARNALLVAAGYAPLFRERPLTDPQLSRRARGRRTGAQGSRALPGARHRPALDYRRREQRARAVAVRRESRTAEASRQCVAAELASGRHRGVDRQLACVAGACAGPAATANRRERRRGAERAARRTGCVPGARRVPSRQSTATAPSLRSPCLLRLRTPIGVLSFFSTTTVFGTPVDVTLSELAIEAFFPADQQTAAALRKAAEGKPTNTR